jgi:hypothetical protein
VAGRCFACISQQSGKGVKAKILTVAKNLVRLYLSLFLAVAILYVYLYSHSVSPTSIPAIAIQYV